MPRRRARTTEKAKWDEDTMTRAVNDVLNGIKKLREAARAYNIPLTTLQNRLKSGNLTGPRLGRKPTFTEQQETEITAHVKNLAKAFYGISPIELRRLVFEFAEANNIPNEFNKSSKLAGPDWLEGFLRRNPTISLRKPEATSLNRIAGFNSDELKLFYKNLSSVMEKYKFDAARIYNVDETGISTVQKPAKILGPKGVKQLGGVTSWERGKNVTVTCAMSASGSYVPPMFIFPRIRMNPCLARGGPPNALYQCSKSGWMTEDLFLVWIEHFIAFTKPCEQSPVMLIMDNHKTHTTLKAYNLCKENYIMVVTLPPHCSHRLQPLDVSFYSSLKGSFSKECDNFLRSHPNEKITMFDVAGIFNKAYSRVANIEKGVNGFASTGIHPLDPNKFNDEFVTSQNEIAMTVIEDREHNEPSLEDITQKSSTSYPTFTPQLTTSNSTSEPQATTSKSTSEPQATTSNSTSEPQATTSNSTSEHQATTPNSTFTSFKHFSPVPPPQVKSNENRKQHSIVFTLTPNKAVLEQLVERKQETEKKKQEAELKRKQRAAEKEVNIKKKFKVKGKSKLRKTSSKVMKFKACVPKKACRRNLSFEAGQSSDEESVDDVEKLCSDDEMDDIDENDILGQDVHAQTRNETESSDVCVMCGEFGKNNELWYRCILCSGWMHSECTGVDTARDFICDFCK